MCRSQCQRCPQRTVCAGSYHEYQSDDLGGLLEAVELRRAFAKQRKKEREKQEKSDVRKMSKAFLKEAGKSGRRMSQAVAERRLSRASSQGNGAAPRHTPPPVATMHLCV